MARNLSTPYPNATTNPNNVDRDFLQPEATRRQLVTGPGATLPATTNPDPGGLNGDRG
jgi:hypothetical protein